MVWLTLEEEYNRGRFLRSVELYCQRDAEGCKDAKCDSFYSDKVFTIVYKYSDYIHMGLRGCSVANPSVRQTDIEREREGVYVCVCVCVCVCVYVCLLRLNQ